MVGTFDELWQKPSCKAQYREDKDEEADRRGSKKVKSGNGPAYRLLSRDWDRWWIIVRESSVVPLQPPHLGSRDWCWWLRQMFTGQHKLEKFEDLKWLWNCRTTNIFHIEVGFQTFISKSTKVGLSRAQKRKSAVSPINEYTHTTF